MNTVGIIGLGTIGTAIADGLQRVRPEMEVFGTRRLETLPRPFITPCAGNVELVRKTYTVVLCVKPQQVANVLEQIGPALEPQHVIISACAGSTLEALHEALPQTNNIARAMPNIACEINEGITGICFSQRWQRDNRDDIVQLFEALGRTVILEERHFDSVTAVSGCGPAYACVIIEALTDAGVKQGLPRDAARLLVAQTLLGSATMVLASEKHPAQIRDRVATPGGCTIDALTALEDGKLRSALISAVATAAAKSAALSNGAKA